MQAFKSSNCVKLTSDNQIVSWINNPTDLLIDIQPNYWPPTITYEEELVTNGNVSVLHYQWCGPLMLVIKEFAKSVNAKVRLFPQIRNFENYMGGLLQKNYSMWPHIMLIPICPYQVNYVAKPVGASISRHIGYFERSSIMSRTQKSEWPLFSYFTCFDIEVYYWIFISIIIMALMICLKRKTFKPFFETVSMYASVILSDYYSIRNISRHNRTFAGIWLLVCNILLAAFGGHLWNLLVRPQPIDKIDSWNDLHTKPQWKDTPILSFDYLDMADFATYDNSEMAQDFRRRLILVNPFEIIFNETMVIDAFKRIFRGEQVLAVDYLIAHFYKSTDKFKVASQLREGFDFHVSESGAGAKPYFIVISPRLNQTLTRKLNDVITRLVESGVYEHEVKKSLIPKGYGPEFTAKVDTTVYEFGPLTMNQMRGIFMSYMIATTFCIIVFILELLTVTYLFSCLKLSLNLLISRFFQNA